MARHPAGSGQGSRSISTGSLRKRWVSVSWGTLGAGASYKLRLGQQRQYCKQLGQALRMRQLGHHDAQTSWKLLSRQHRRTSTTHLCRRWGLGSLWHYGRRDILQTRASAARAPA